jgi:hypothetical protein
MRKIIACIALAASIAPSVALAQGIPVSHGFLSGNRFRGYPEIAQRGYIMGVIDGFLFSPVLGAPVRRPSEMSACLFTNMQATDAQVLAIVNRYLDKNPAAWGDDMHSLVFRAVREACTSRGLSLD